MRIWNLTLAVLLFTIAGCGESETAPNSESASTEGVTSQYVVDAEPTGALSVGEAREVIEDQQSVTVFGTIGGSTEPFVTGLAAFTIVDTRVPYCAPDEGCPTPWDYCCTQDQVKGHVATVKLVDESGNPVEEDARKLLGVKELSTVVVQGKAQRDDQGNLTVAAAKIFVRSGQ